MRYVPAEPLFIAILLGALLAGSGAAQAKVRFEKLELRVPGTIMWVGSGDLDGDGGTDLVVGYRRGSGPATKRFLGIFFRGPNGYAARPDAAFSPPPSAVAFDLGDALGGPADELLYLSSDGVYAQSFSARKPNLPSKLINTRPLAGRAEEDNLVAWDFVRAIDPGKPPMLLLPRNGPFKIYQRTEDSWSPWATVWIRPLSFYDAERPTFRRSRRGASGGRPYSYSVTTIIPTLFFVDQTGDGRIDLVTAYEDRIMLFPRLEDGSFSREPSQEKWFRLRTQEEEATRDNEIEVQVLDLDGDKVADLSATKIGGGLMTLRTETRLYRGKKGGGFEDNPSQVLKDSGFAALVEYVDVDGDGQLEMVQPRAEVSILAMSKALLSSELSLSVRIRKRNREGGRLFGEPVQSLDAHYSLDFKVGGALRGTPPILGFDLDGDGKNDGVLSRGADTIGIHHGVHEDEEILEEEPRVELSAPATRQTLLVFPKARERGRPDLLLYYTDYPERSGFLTLFRNVSQ